MLVVQLGEVLLDRWGLGVCLAQSCCGGFAESGFLQWQLSPIAMRDLTCLPYRSEMLREWEDFAQGRFQHQASVALCLKCAVPDALLAAGQLLSWGQS